MILHSLGIKSSEKNGKKRQRNDKKVNYGLIGKIRRGCEILVQVSKFNRNKIFPLLLFQGNQQTPSNQNTSQSSSKPSDAMTYSKDKTESTKLFADTVWCSDDSTEHIHYLNNVPKRFN